MDTPETIFFSRFPDAQPPERHTKLVVVEAWTRVATYNAGNQTRRTVLVVDAAFLREGEMAELAAAATAGNA
jgi:hypothetical protein